MTSSNKSKAIIDELRESDLPAEVILDRQRKRQIEAELAEKEEASRRKKSKMGEEWLIKLSIHYILYVKRVLDFLDNFLTINKSPRISFSKLWIKVEFTLLIRVQFSLFFLVFN